MSKSHRHQQSALLDKLVSRARSKQPGLSKPAMVLAYGFGDQAQLDDALNELVECGAIQIDINGRWPSIRILKTRMRALHLLRRPLYVSAGSDRDTTSLARSDWRDVAAEARKVVLEAEDALTGYTPAPVPSPVPKQVVSPISAVEAALELETKRDQTIPYYVSFRLPKEDFTWLLDEMDRSGQATALPGFARDMLLAEMDRRRSPDGAKHRISARVIRTAREEGLDLGTFVTNLIEVGLTAREMNRRGI